MKLANWIFGAALVLAIGLLGTFGYFATADVVYPDAGNVWFGVAVFAAITGSLFLNGLRKIEAQPPHIGLLTVLGKRFPIVVSEGWALLPFYPWIFGVIPVRVTKVNQDFVPAEGVRTPGDRAEISIPLSITWIPAKDSGSGLIEFLDSGGEEGVKSILDDVVHERVREWATSPGEGPLSWEEAYGANEEAIGVILKAILGDTLCKIHSDIPTAMLLRYFAKPRRFPSNTRDIERWGPKWEMLEKELPDDCGPLEREMEQRRREIQTVRNGSAKMNKLGLGVYITRLNVGEIKLLGKLAEAAEKEATEIQERKAEVFEVDTDIQKARQLVVAAEGQLTFQDAYRITMDYKATREGHGFVIPGIAPAAVNLIKKILGS